MSVAADTQATDQNKGICAPSVNGDLQKLRINSGPINPVKEHITVPVFPNVPQVNENTTQLDKEELQVFPECPVCLEEMPLSTICPCGHSFCQDCISKWIQNNQNCPLCRAPVKAVPRRQKSNVITAVAAPLQQTNNRTINDLASRTPYMSSYTRIPERKSRWSRFLRKFKIRRRDPWTT